LVLLYRGYAYNKLEQYEKAIEEYKKALEIDPDNEMAAMNLESTQKKLAMQSPTPTPTPTPTATPTVTPTAIPAAEAPEEPGFETVFSIAGLLAVAYLLRRKG
jgi:tetratricopeptide (TPR) repeat protein